MREEVFYIFEYCFCVYEGSFQTISLHRSKKGAYQAMMKHKNDEWHQERRLGLEASHINFGKKWRINEIILMD